MLGKRSRAVLRAPAYAVWLGEDHDLDVSNRGTPKAVFLALEDRGEKDDTCGTRAWVLPSLHGAAGSLINALLVVPLVLSLSKGRVRPLDCRDDDSYRQSAYRPLLVFSSFVLYPLRRTHAPRRRLIAHIAG